MTRYRIEKDLLGEREVPADALYGVHTLRSVENFPLSRRAVNPALIHAYGAVKLACARTNHELGWWDDEKANAIEQACSEMMEGLLDVHIVTDALHPLDGMEVRQLQNAVEMACDAEPRAPFGTAVITFDDWKQLSADRLLVGEGTAAVDLSVAIASTSDSRRASRPCSTTSMRRAPASRAFSTSSFSTELGRSTTSPAAIWFATWSGSTRILAMA